jgi:energy-converting hydrogenase Eha subunit B
MFGSFGLQELLIVVVVAALIVWPATRICSKAGYTSWLGLLIVVPLANVVLLWFLALADWPRLKPGA